MTTKAQSIEFLLSQVRASGVALAGGEVEFFAAGTSTPKLIWLDRNKAEEAANPYTLDANGTAQLFADGVYRVVIRDSTGVEKYDRDGLSFRDASSNVYDVADYASLAAAVTSIGSTPATLQFASDVTVSANFVIPSTLELMPLNGAKINHTTYTVTANSSTARWPLAQVFNGTGLVTFPKTTVIPPEWQGCAVGNTVTANTDALAKVIASAKVNGNTVQFSVGTYSLNTHVPIRQDESVATITEVISYNNIVLQGRGRGTVLKTANVTYGADVFQFRGVSDITVRDLTVDSDVPGAAVDGSNGFSFTDGSHDIKIERVHAEYLAYRYSPGPTDLSGGAAYSIQDNHATLGMYNIDFIDCTGDGGAFGFHYNGSGAAAKGVAPAKGIKFTDGRLKGFYQGVGIETGKAGAAEVALPTQGISVTGVQISDCQRGMWLMGSTNVDASNNKVMSTLTSAVDPVTGLAWKSDDTTLRGVTALSLFYSDVSRNTIYQASVANYMFLGGGASGVPATPTTKSNFIGNVMHGAASGDAIAVETANGGLLDCQVNLNSAVGSASDIYQVLTGGNFASATGWTAGTGWEITGGAAVATAVAGSQAVFKNVNLVAGKKYLLSVDVAGYSGTGTGGFYVYEEGGGDSLTTAAQFTGNGAYSRVISPAVTGSYRIGIAGVSTYNASHDNLNVSPIQ